MSYNDLTIVTKKDGKTYEDKTNQIELEKAFKDFIKVQGGGWAEEGYCSIELRADTGRVILSPDKIRKLRKQLKRALIEIEGLPGESL